MYTSREPYILGYRFLSANESYEIRDVSILVVNPVSRDVGVFSANESYVIKEYELWTLYHVI